MNSFGRYNNTRKIIDFIIHIQIALIQFLNIIRFHQIFQIGKTTVILITYKLKKKQLFVFRSIFANIFKNLILYSLMFINLWNTSEK